MVHRLNKMLNRPDRPFFPAESDDRIKAAATTAIANAAFGIRERIDAPGLLGYRAIPERRVYLKLDAWENKLLVGKASVGEGITKNEAETSEAVLVYLSAAEAGLAVARERMNGVGASPAL